MNTRQRRKSGMYFERHAGDPAPLTVQVKRRVLFSDADPMGILWHGRYPAFFEAAAAELHRACGLGYLDFQNAGIRAPIIQLQIAYLNSIFLEEEVTIQGILVWNDAARIDTEYSIIKSNGQLASHGCTVQLFTEAESGAPLLTSPAFVEASRQAWRDGQFSSLQ